MKFPITLLFFLVVSFSVISQIEISGSVFNAKNRKPVESAIVTLHPAGSASILSHTMTDKDGTFTLKCAAIPDSVTLSVRAMTIKSQSKTVKSNVGFVELPVEENVTKLKEVIVQAPKIRQLGDTIHYDVSSFLDETDRSIGDVLRKLPGVQVLSSGQIMYQNKAISKFYIEGLDMLKGKYGIATNNIDAKNVASVQVLENHQPIKALKNMEIPEAAAINLKLKSSAKGAFFATAQLGAGLPAWLLSNELVGMRFTRKQQNMLVYKGDNTGRDIAQELTSFYGESGNASTSFLNVVFPSPPGINRQHFLFNDAHLGSLNDLYTLKKDLTLTTNINYLFDKHTSDSYARRDIAVDGSENIRIEENMSSRLLKRELEGAVTLERNTDNFFLNNKLNLSTKWNNESGDVWTGKTISQRLTLPSVHVANNFYYVRRNGKKRFRFQSDVSYTTQDNTLSVMPSIFGSFSDTDSLLRQNILYNRFATNTSISGSREGKVSLHYAASIFSNHYTFESTLHEGINAMMISADSMRNQLSRGEIGFRFSSGIRVTITKKLKPYFSFPITYLLVNKNDRVRHIDSHNGYWFLGPSVHLKYPVSTRITLYGSARYNNNIGGIHEDLIGYMMTSYRNLNRNDGLQSKNSTAHLYANLNYRNPFTTLFMTLGVNWMNNWRNMLYDTHYTGILSSATSILHPHSAQQFSITFSAEKSVDAICSELRAGTRYIRNKSIALNQGVISPFTSNSYNVFGSSTTDIGRFMILKYSATYSQNRIRVSDNRMNPMHYFTQSLNTSFIPKKGLIFNVGFNHYFNDAIQSVARSSWFGNAGIKYKLKTVDLMLDWTNVFNTRRFVTYSYSDVSSYYSEYALRSSEVLLRVRFKIL